MRGADYCPQNLLRPDTSRRDDVPRVVLICLRHSRVLVFDRRYHREESGLIMRALTARLPADRTPRVLATALSIDSSFAEQCLRTILAAIPQPPWRTVFDLVNAVPNDSVKAPALTRLVEYADESLIGEISGALQHLSDPLIRARALGQIAPRLGDALALQALAAGWAAMNGVADDGTVIDLLMRGTVGETVRDDLLPAAVSTVLTLLDNQLRARTLETLAPHLSPELLEHALKGLQVLRDDSERARTLTALLAALQTKSDRAQVANIAAPTARGVPWADRRATRLAELAAETEHETGESLLRDALVAVYVTPERSRTEPLLAIGAALTRSSEASMAAALTLVERLPLLRMKRGRSGLRSPPQLAAMLPNLATPLGKSLRIGGTHVASAPERIRLLAYLALDQNVWNGLHASEVGTNDDMKQRMP